jgi:hypothetical protein
MIKKIVALLGVGACAALVVVFAPSFAHDLAAGVERADKLQIAAADYSPTSALFGACPREPWPYGCVWHQPIVQKDVARKVRNRHHQFAFSAAAR